MFDAADAATAVTAAAVAAAAAPFANAIDVCAAVSVYWLERRVVALSFCDL